MKKIITLMLVAWNSMALSGTLHFGVQALYLQPDLDEVNFRGITTLPGGALQYTNQNPHYAWGFKAEGSYHFNEAYDINLNGYHVEKTNKNNFGSLIGNEGNLLSSASGTIQPSWSAINFEGGQQIDPGPTRMIRLHAGVQYAQISADETAVVALVTEQATIPSGKTINRAFHGVGPRLGADLAHHWSSGWGIYANAATALLTGQHNSTTTYSLAFTPPNRSASSSVIVPELESKLGTTFTYGIEQGDLIFDAGWMWINYFKAIYYENYSLPLNLGIAHGSTSFALQGPYIGLKWVGHGVA